MRMAVRHETHFIDVTQSWSHRLRFRFGLLLPWLRCGLRPLLRWYALHRQAGERQASVRDLLFLFYSDNPKLSVVDSF